MGVYFHYMENFIRLSLRKQVRNISSKSGSRTLFRHPVIPTDCYLCTPLPCVYTFATASFGHKYLLQPSICHACTPSGSHFRCFKWRHTKWRLLVGITGCRNIVSTPKSTVAWFSLRKARGIVKDIGRTLRPYSNQFSFRQKSLIQVFKNTFAMDKYEIFAEIFCDIPSGLLNLRLYTKYEIVLFFFSF